MDSLLIHSRVERARPLLGTVVKISIQGLPEAEANSAINNGFAVISKVHGLMSFHEGASELSQLNRSGYKKSIEVHPYTFDVLRRTVDLAADTHGVFDPTIAGHLVEWGLLPSPEISEEIDPKASWRDIELLEGNRVQFNRPLLIDLGGIAKGYAVDRAIESLCADEEVQCCVNAGGDLRVQGPYLERIRLNVQPSSQKIPVLEIENGSVASSGGHGLGRRIDGKATGLHLDGSSRNAVGAHSFVSVLADECVTADALTKVVLAKCAKADPILRSRGAAAYLHNACSGWQKLGIAHE
ncbi:MAG TPA: FAD:protein FMN transferase [Rhodospirillaceae bacterium]|nr:thiamine biosynthesis protein ApbE [Candidatus Neomarinimicrobiota bacterium]HCX15222.1 FAD:protein FMN transferase [Rhodospirillaceae bacterium]